MKLYQFKISIIGIPKLYRIIEASGNCTFNDLHEKIFEAFNRFDPHLYSFFVTKSDTKNIRSIIKAPEITHPEISMYLKFHGHLLTTIYDDCLVLKFT
jgi:hypothetical protein